MVQGDAMPEATETVEEQAVETAEVEQEIEQTPETPTKETEVAEEETLLGKKEEVKVEAPENYEFKLPEGMELDTGLFEKFEPILKEIGISQEQAQKLVDVYAPHVQSQAEEASKVALEEYQKTIEGWKSETLKELGKEPEKQLALAAKAIDKFGGQKLRDALEDSGFGNHPDMVRAFISIGKVISDDSFIDPSEKKNKPQGIDARTIFPSMKE
jgi:hypothetical protein